MDARRLIPRTDQVLADPRLAAAEQRLGRATVRAAVAPPSSGPGTAGSAPEQVADAAVAALPRPAATLTPVINATGVLLHTNLGRAPLSGAAQGRAWPPRRAAPTWSSIWLPGSAGRRGRGRAGRAGRGRCPRPGPCTW